MRQIIFDLDDTLYQSKELRAKREKAILDYLGDKKEKYKILKQNHGTLESLRLLGIGKKNFFDLMDKVEINLEKDDKLIRLFEKLNKKFKIIILSNSSDFCVQETLNKLGILYLIDKCYSGEDFEMPKPAKDCFFMVEKENICIGNNFEKDLFIPKQLGAITIHLGDSCEADFNICSIYELEELLEKF